jgi:diadenosine tetraphosphatase ApaH/serine/threonine PP2A family protein phosphatase
VRYLIIADIHSNLEAFEAVLNDAEQSRGGFDAVWCLGDIVGYGPDPAQCISLLRGFGPLCVCGNHDLATVGRLALEEFNEDAAAANDWNSRQLSGGDREYLLGLPETLVEADFTLVHGSPGAPLWEYITSEYSARDNFPLFSTSFCLAGHCHLPLCFEEDGPRVNEMHLRDGDVLELGKSRLIVNPGGLGQPRDRDPRAGYIIFDDGSMTLHSCRCTYDVALTQRKMEQAGLPVFLIERLEWGV